MKKKTYLVLDTETCTLPFADELCTTTEEKQTIAIAKPLVYDIGWVIVDRKGNELKRVNYLVQETFFVPNVFNTAYYKDKRPKYLEMYNNGEILAKNWNNIIDELKSDLETVDLCLAYNACFDYKKAIPFTEKYIANLYSTEYTKWEEGQRWHCGKLLTSKTHSTNPEYMNPTFKLRGTKYPMADLWAIACDKLINIEKYKKYCYTNDLFTKSGKYFKTSAETSYQYLANDYGFVESHTALDDSIIESKILLKALAKGKVTPYLKAFPFKDLGTVEEYELAHPILKKA